MLASALRNGTAPPMTFVIGPVLGSKLAATKVLLVREVGIKTAFTSHDSPQFTRRFIRRGLSGKIVVKTGKLIGLRKIGYRSESTRNYEAGTRDG
jgi:hypothetical protein